MDFASQLSCSILGSFVSLSSLLEWNLPCNPIAISFSWEAPGRAVEAGECRSLQPSIDTFLKFEISFQERVPRRASVRSVERPCWQPGAKTHLVGVKVPGAPRREGLCWQLGSRPHILSYSLNS